MFTHAFHFYESILSRQSSFELDDLIPFGYNLDISTSRLMGQSSRGGSGLYYILYNDCTGLIV